MSCGVGHRHGLDPTLLWLWCGLAAIALIQPLAWEPPWPYKKQKEKKVMVVLAMPINDNLFT